MRGKRGLQTAAGVVLVIVVLALLTVWLEVLFRESGRQWSAAVQSAVAVFLAIATAVYATLTYRMVRGMERAPREASQLRAAGELSSMLALNVFRVNLISDQFPIDTARSVPKEPFFTRESISTVRDLSDAIDGLSWQVPVPLIGPTKATVNKLLRLANAMVRLNAALVLADRDAKTAGREEPSWEDLRSVYYVQIRDAVFPSEWDELVDGAVAREAAAAVGNLELEAGSAVIGPASRRRPRQTR
jgi:hypothetical protein